MQGGGGPAEPTAERHPQSDPGEKLTIAIEQSVLTDDVKSNAKVREPAPVRESETGRARNWTMPPLRLERECKEHSAEQNDLLSFCERRNSATIDNRCVEFDRRESTESTAIIGLRALGRRIAFTMAEILLSLTIIGVVAAITLPSLTGNINERTWNTQRKALYARFSQAIALMPALNGYGTLQEMTDSTTGSTSIEDTAAETFVTAGLSKVLKINNICDSEHLEDCGIPDKINPFSGNSVTLDDINTLHGLSHLFKNPDCSALPYCYSQIDTKVSAIETQNGESILVYYNPKCNGLQNVYDTYFFPQPRMCANFVYDLNGSKGPNNMGKDIGFMTAFYPTDPVVVAPMPISSDVVNPHNMVPFTNTGKSCLAIDSESRVPNLEEMISIIFNAKIIGNLNNQFYWSSTLGENGLPWNITSSSARIKTDPKTTAMSVRCIRR